MKTLFESILDDEDILVNNDNAVIEQWIEDHYNVYGDINIHDGVVDVKGIIAASNQSITSLTSGTFRFGVIDGDFTVLNTGLRSLEGAPKEVKGSFIIEDNELLKSLEGAPKKVNKNFRCAGCTKLESLKGCPEVVGRNFNCRNCTSLKSLEGGPKKSTYKIASYDCSFCDKLVNLKGAPEKVNGGFYCEGCKNLTSLEGGPKKVGSFTCNNCPKLKNIKDRPKKIEYSMYFSDTPAYKEYLKNDRRFID